MGKLIIYNFVSANGYFKGPNEDISWVTEDSAEAEEFAVENLKNENILIFGRNTYEMMAAYWPTKEAIKAFPKIAEGMNKAEKIVFSTKMKSADWNNSKLIRTDLSNEIRKLKQIPDRNLTVLGSGTIVNQLMQLALVDELQIMIHPVMIGGGTTFLNDVTGRQNLTLLKTKPLKSGIVVLFYQPVYA